MKPLQLMIIFYFDAKRTQKKEKMQFTGRYIIDAPRIKVWEALNDEDILQKTIFGCQKISWVSKEQLELEVLVNLGVVKRVFFGDLILENVIEAKKYTLKGRGRGGILGKVHASADIELKDHGSGTCLKFSALGGGSSAIMTLGKSIVGKSAQKIIDKFFERFAKAMGVEIFLDDEAIEE